MAYEGQKTARSGTTNRKIRGYSANGISYGQT